MPDSLAGYLPRHVALEHHLAHNHFPPVRRSFLPAADQAIEGVINAVEWFDIETGEVSYDDSVFQQTIEVDGQSFTVGKLMDGLHLWDFVLHALATNEVDQIGDPEFKAGER